MAFLLNKTTIASHFRSHSQKGEDLLSLSRRQYHIEPGPREKALLAEDAALRPFKSYKQSVKKLKKVGDILTIVVVAEKALLLSLLRALATPYIIAVGVPRYEIVYRQNKNKGKGRIWEGKSVAGWLGYIAEHRIS
ncbi:Succinate dehydrogenase subunit 7B [Arachis hypogaea]|nr:Succinate dehydrogenase subunit 7B [Arachis hypogaea]